MITNILKLLWNRRKANVWLWVELLVVFILLWYVVDYQYSAWTCAHEPKGYSTERVYHVSFVANPALEAEYAGEKKEAAFQQVFRQVENYPGVEAACYYFGTIVYENHSMFQGYTIDSTKVYVADVKYVSRGYFDVFKVPIEQGSVDNWDRKDFPRPIVISRDLADSLFNNKPLIGAALDDYYSPGRHYTLAGIAPLSKLNEFERYSPLAYLQPEDFMMTWDNQTVAIRVSPEADNGFIDRFTADNSRLQAGPFTFTWILKYDDIKATNDHVHTTDQWLHSISALIWFFLFNVFLGILGTFWFTTRKRRGEIGLRMAMGASKRRVFAELTVESLLLLLSAALPATVVCFNIWHAELTVTFSDITGSRLLLGLALTLLILAAAVVIGVWYPARQAARTVPSEALSSE